MIFAAFATSGEASLFAAAVHLLKEVTQHADERATKAPEQREESDGAPDGSVGRQPRLRARRNERQRQAEHCDEAQGSSEYVKHT